MAIENIRLRAAVVGVALLVACLASVLDASAPKKLYRWVGADGKPYYSDQVPAEAMDKARQELSVQSGLTVGHVDRALTPEEQAAAAAKTAADAKTAQSQETAKQSDQVLLASYPTEADLKHAYDERIVLQAEAVKATRFGIQSQQQSLAARLAVASNLELNGKPVNPKLADDIQMIRKQLVNQQALLIQHIAEGAKMQSEYSSTLEHYRSLQAAAAAARATPSPGAVPKG